MLEVMVLEIHHVDGFPGVSVFLILLIQDHLDPLQLTLGLHSVQSQAHRIQKYQPSEVHKRARIEQIRVNRGAFPDNIERKADVAEGKCHQHDDRRRDQVLPLHPHLRLDLQRLALDPSDHHQDQNIRGQHDGCLQNLIHPSVMPVAFPHYLPA